MVSFGIPDVGGVGAFLQRICLCCEKRGEFGDGDAREVGGVLGASGSCLFPEGLSLSPAGGPEPKVDGFPAGLIWESQLLVG